LTEDRGPKTESFSNHDQRTAGQQSAVRGQVLCHSGYEYAQRPIAFQWEGEQLAITQVKGEWKTPDGKLFRVLTEGDQVFELHYNSLKDKWYIQQQ